MANNDHTSGYWLNTDGYKNLDKTQQANIQKDFVTMNNNQKAGKFNGEGAYNIAAKYGLYTAPSVDSKINSINQTRQDNFAKVQNGYYDDAENRKYSTSDELYAYDLYKKTGDTTFWQPYKQGQAESPYDDLQKLFNLPSQLGNNKAYDVWNRQSDMFKANTMAGQAMGYQMQGQGDGQGVSSGGGGGGGAGGGGEFDDLLKMFMLMMMQNGGKGAQGNQQMYNGNQFGDGVHLFNEAQHNAGMNTSSSSGALNEILKKMSSWEGKL